ncbi:hypothetical protein DK182_01610 [Streptococcus sobrinus]|uniref:Uncharacterized protein n=1 Tax=Streptococcus sobrinus TaxID=1310 RepID=A0ABM6W3T7_9STRE|nr:hypothetical protein DK182_01610 [Streptococcus sobrinus]
MTCEVNEEDRKLTIAISVVLPQVQKFGSEKNIKNQILKFDEYCTLIKGNKKRPAEASPFNH